MWPWNKKKIEQEPIGPIFLANKWLQIKKENLYLIKEVIYNKGNAVTSFAPAFFKPQADVFSHSGDILEYSFRNNIYGEIAFIKNDRIELCNMADKLPHSKRYEYVMDQNLINLLECLLHNRAKKLAQKEHEQIKKDKNLFDKAVKNTKCK